jgi:hypothetical protein
MSVTVLLCGANVTETSIIGENPGINLYFLRLAALIAAGRSIAGPESTSASRTAPEFFSFSSTITIRWSSAPGEGWEVEAAVPGVTLP